MVGRKRKNVKREPNGREQREPKVDVVAVARTQPHRRLVPEHLAHDARAESFLGRLRLNGWITPMEYRAGVKYREIVGRYRVLIGGPRGEVSLCGVVVGPWGGSGIELDADEIQRRKDAYNGAYEFLDANAGHRAAVALAWAINERPGVIVPDLIRALDKLCEHFELTNTRKSASQK